jgi:hypothetical protein
MEDARKKYLELLKNKELMPEGATKWLDEFRNASPKRQYYLKNVMQRMAPIKPSRNEGEQEELPLDIRKKQRLQIIKKRYMKA